MQSIALTYMTFISREVVRKTLLVKPNEYSMEIVKSERLGSNGRLLKIPYILNNGCLFILDSSSTDT